MTLETNYMVKAITYQTNCGNVEPEKLLHEKYGSQRLNGEWFKGTEELLLEFCVKK